MLDEWLRNAGLPGLPTTWEGWAALAFIVSLVVGGLAVVVRKTAPQAARSIRRVSAKMQRREASVGAPQLAAPEIPPVGARPGPLTLPQKCVRLADEIEAEVARRDHLPFRERQPDDTSYRAFLKPLREMEEELRVVAHMPVGNLAQLHGALDLGREQALGMVRALRGLVWAGRSDLEPSVPPARFYIGKGSWYQGIPARDLTPQEYAGLTMAQRELVDSGEIYTPTKRPASSKVDVVVEASDAADAFANSPHLMWSGAHAVKPGYYGEVSVLCTNVGGVAQVLPDCWVTSTVKLADGTEQSEPIAFSAFDTQGQILPGAFTLRMAFGERYPFPGDRTVTWRVVYMDDDLAHGFITECSVDVRVVLETYQLVGQPRLDISSRRTRNDDYNADYRDKTAPSTGKRRRHLPRAEDSLVLNRPPRVDLDETTRRADKALERSRTLDLLLEEADAISELLRRDELDGTRVDRWTSDADHFVALNFDAYATDFRIARDPKHVRLSGAHTDRIWLPLKRLTAQMEVLQEIKRDLRADRPGDTLSPR